MILLLLLMHSNVKICPQCLTLSGIVYLQVQLTPPPAFVDAASYVYEDQIGHKEGADHN